MTGRLVSQGALDACVADLAPVGLGDLDAAASLQTRVDRKYIVSPAQAAVVISEVNDRLAALEIDGRRSFDYRSVYFDTVDLVTFHAAAHRRRQRFKVRTRAYVDTDTTKLEVKMRGARGATLKRRCDHGCEPRSLGLAGGAFVDRCVDAAIADTLMPVLETSYERLTLVDLDDVARMTIDRGLVCEAMNGRSVGLGDWCVIETKSTATPSVIDRSLWRLGQRPQKISKYCTGLAALHPTLPSNVWHRTLRSYFDTAR